MEFTALLSLDTFLDALFLWITPLEAALSMVEEASSSALEAASLSPDSTAASTFFTEVLTADLMP